MGGGALHGPMMMSKGVCKGGMKGGGCKGAFFNQQHELECQGFIEFWGLDPEAYQALRSLPLQAQSDTMQKFSPKAGTRDVKGLFMSFVRSMSTGEKGFGGKGLGFTGFAPPAAVMRPLGGGRIAQVGPAMAQVGPSMGIKRQRAVEEAAPVPIGGTDIFAFTEHWNLDEEALGGLGEMPEEVQQDIMNTFAPRNTTKDVKNLFMSFLRSRASGPVAKKPRIEVI